jgi:hypothetical protein
MIFLPLANKPGTARRRFGGFLNVSLRTRIRQGAHAEKMSITRAAGREFIRDLHNDPPLRKRPVGGALLQMIGRGGPLLCHGGDDQQRSFDSACRKFRRFLTETGRVTPKFPQRREGST